MPERIVRCVCPHDCPDGCAILVTVDDVAPMGWWNRDYRGNASAQATTSQRLTTLGNAPIFNDNRVEVAPSSPSAHRPQRTAVSAGVGS